MWKENESSLSREFKFPDFISAFSFMTQVAMTAEKLNHHPEWSNVYNKVTVKLSTHDAGNKVTVKDRELAGQIDKIFRCYEL